MEEKKMWENRCIFLNGVTGRKIVETQEMINAGDEMFVTATQIIPRHKLVVTERGEVLAQEESNDVEDVPLKLYDAFIYYKVSSDAIKLGKDEVFVTEKGERFDTKPIVNLNALKQ